LRGQRTQGAKKIADVFFDLQDFPFFLVLLVLRASEGCTDEKILNNLIQKG